MSGEVPPVIQLCREGLARFCTEAYVTWTVIEAHEPSHDFFFSPVGKPIYGIGKWAGNYISLLAYGSVLTVVSMRKPSMHSAIAQHTLDIDFKLILL